MLTAFKFHIIFSFWQFPFVGEIANLSTHGYFMVSFNDESLFTNIPLEESIDLAVKYILEGNPNLKLDQSCLKKLFMFATAETHFSFNGVFTIKLTV